MKKISILISALIFVFIGFLNLDAQETRINNPLIKGKIKLQNGYYLYDSLDKGIKIDGGLWLQNELWINSIQLKDSSNFIVFNKTPKFPITSNWILDGYIVSLNGSKIVDSTIQITKLHPDLIDKIFNDTIGVRGLTNLYNILKFRYDFLHGVEGHFKDELFTGVVKYLIPEEESMTPGVFYLNIGRTLDTTGGVLNVISIPGSIIDDRSLTSTQIGDTSISSSKLKVNVIDSSKILNGSIANNDLDTNSVNEINIQNNSISASKLQNNSVTSDKISNSSITSSKLANNSVTGSKLLDGSVTTSKLNFYNDIALKVDTYTKNDVDELLNSERNTTYHQVDSIGAGAKDTMEVEKYMLLVNCNNSQNDTVVLGTVTNGYECVIKKIDANATYVVVMDMYGFKIDGLTEDKFNGANESKTYIYRNSNWYIKK